MAEGAVAGSLARECSIFTRYLIGCEPPSDIVTAYQRAHAVSAVAASRASPPLDRALLAVAHVGPRLARTADAYAALFAKASLLRRKLVLLVAILESRQQTAALIDTSVPGSLASGFLAVGLNAFASASMACFAALLIGPLFIWYRAAGVGEA